MVKCVLSIYVTNSHIFTCLIELPFLPYFFQSRGHYLIPFFRIQCNFRRFSSFGIVPRLYSYPYSVNLHVLLIMLWHTLFLIGSIHNRLKSIQSTTVYKTISAYSIGVPPIWSIAARRSRGTIRHQHQSRISCITRNRGSIILGDIQQQIHSCINAHMNVGPLSHFCRRFYLLSTAFHNRYIQAVACFTQGKIILCVFYHCIMVQRQQNLSFITIGYYTDSVVWIPSHQSANRLIERHHRLFDSISLHGVRQVDDKYHIQGNERLTFHLHSGR